MSVSLHPFFIMVTRPSPEGEALCQEIEQCGGKAIFFPTIVIAPLDNSASLQQQFACMQAPDWLIFMSPQAVYASAALIHDKWPTLPTNLSVAAVGQGTARVLMAMGFSKITYPKEAWCSEGLIDLPVFQSIRGKHIVVLKGQGGRDVLQKRFAEKEAAVIECILYQRVLPAISELPDIKQGTDVIVCTSVDSVRNLKTLYGTRAFPLLSKVPLLVISERIKILARDLGFQTIWMAKNASHAAIIAALKEGLTHDR